MHYSRLTSAARQVLALALVAILSSFTWGQQTDQQSQQQPVSPSQAHPNTTVPVETPQPHRVQLQDYTKAKGYFPNPVAPYTPRTVPPPDLSNTPRFEQLLQNGKLMLSMDDAVALALENNMDIAIQRYNVAIADTDVLRAKAGSAILGVPFGVVQNTPGGTTGGLGGSVGSGPGGTSAGSAGAGAGLGGLVTSTLGQGPPIISFDPFITGTLQMDRNFTQSSSIFSPVAVGNLNTATANFAYNQGFHWGTNMLVGFNNTHTTSNNPTNTYTPFIN